MKSVQVHSENSIFFLWLTFSIGSIKFSIHYNKMFYTYRKYTEFESPTLPFYVVETKICISPYHLKLTFGFGVYKDDTDDC